MKDDCVPRLGMVQNEASCRPRGISLIVEVLTVNKKSSLQTKQQYSRQRSPQHPRFAESRQPRCYKNQQRRQTEDHVAPQKHRTRKRQQYRQGHKKEQPDPQNLRPPGLPSRTASEQLSSKWHHHTGASHDADGGKSP